MATYKENTYSSKFVIQRWLHKKRFATALKVLKLENLDQLLDYGCGDAHFLEICSQYIPFQNLYGFEPANVMYKEAVKNIDNNRITIVGNIKDLNKKFTAISCLETCEHLSDNDLKNVFINIQSLLSPGGRVAISVPIEIGLSSIIKNLFRFIRYGRIDNLNIKNCLKAIFGMTIPRNENKKLDNVNYIYTHIGFNHKKFESLLCNYFKIKSKRYSPIHFLGPVLNSTIYYICAKNDFEGQEG